jgi:general secretion pathway protein C
VADPAAVARLLGAAAPAATAAPVAASRFVLLGVMASPSSRGAALIAIDGKPGRAFRVGSKVDEGLVLEAVEPRKARLAQATGTGESMVLEMPVSRK